MAIKNLEIKTDGAIDDKAEKTAANVKKARRGPSLKSSYGPRNVKVTFLAPQALLDDLTAILAKTGGSRGDVLNKAIEDYVKKHPEELEKGREIVQGYDN